MAVGAGRGAIAPPPPQYFGNQKKFKIIKTTTYRSVYIYMAKYVNRSVDIGNHIYTNEQNCILFKKSMIPKKIFCPPIPKSFLRPCGTPKCHDHDILTLHQIAAF